MATELFSQIAVGGSWGYALYGLVLTIAVALCLAVRVVVFALRQAIKWTQHELVYTKFGPRMVWNTLVPVFARLAAMNLPRDWMRTSSPLVELKYVLGVFALAHAVCLLSAWAKTFFPGFSFNSFARKSATIYAIEGAVYVFILGSSIPSLFFKDGVLDVVPSKFNMSLPWIWILLLHSNTARRFMNGLYSCYHPNVKEIYADMA